MKIKKITIDNIRCFKHLEIDFNSNNELKKWALIIGDNGVGKTTILRSIAIGLTEVSGASGLVDDLGSDWIRRECTEGSIRLDIEPYPACKENTFITTKFIMNDFKEVEVSQEVNPIKPDTFDWDNLFVCAYGAARSLHATESYSDYVITDSVYTLIRYSQPLQNPELNIRRIQSLGIDETKIFNLLESILMLEKGAITLDFSGIKVSGPWGRKMPMDALGDGYIATITWIIDMFGWKSLFEGKKKEVSINRILNISGIILLDEIEQHLHPKWQKNIVKLVRDQFSELQFIATTHSPLCVVGTTDLRDEECSIVVLEQKEKQIECRVSTPPRGKRVDQVLTSYIFDLLTASDNALKRDIERYSKLYSRESRTNIEEKELHELYSSLDAQLGSGETELEKKATNILDRILEELYNEKLKKFKDKKSPVNYEVLRQLKNLIE
ncbi:MAG: AAA family ATPase [Candidatus Marinimicrobia bacterium]|nr:AAA family ATPase [Candidatus Neomarinimicrobiota bacterium]